MATLAALLGLDLLEELPELAAALNPPEWHARAACRGMDTALFFPVRGAVPTKARAICTTCPVAAECHAQAVEGDEAGVWGGTTAAERRRRLVA